MLKTALSHEHALVKVNIKELLHNLITSFLILKTLAQVALSPDSLIPQALGNFKVHTLILFIHFDRGGICLSNGLGNILFEFVLYEEAALAILDQDTVKTLKLLGGADRPTNVANQQLHDYVDHRQGNIDD